MQMDCYIGQIELFPYTFAPDGWVSCEGQTLNVSQYSALYAIIGNTYGGNSTVFNLPNLLGTEPIPYTKYYIVPEDGYFPARQ